MKNEIASVDLLRSLDEIGVADIRNSFFSRFDSIGIRADSLKEHHSDISRMRLSSNVPEDVVVQFETAKNLYLCAWYVYRFYPVAQHQALTCLEFGLRERFAKELPVGYRKKSNAPPTLRTLLRYAVDFGFIRNEGFRQWREHVQKRAQERCRNEQIATMLEQDIDACEVCVDQVVPNEKDHDVSYVSILKEVLPGIRNSHAHGSFNLTNQVLGTFELVQEILDQVFSEKHC